MSFPNLVPVPSLGLSLPPLPPYQKWALNKDTNSIVLIEFVYDKDTTLANQSAAQNSSTESVLLFNTTLQESLSLINSQLQTFENRLNVLESTITSITSFSIANTGTT